MGILYTTKSIPRAVKVAKFISKLTIDCYLSRLLVFAVKLTVIMAEILVPELNKTPSCCYARSPDVRI